MIFHEKSPLLLMEAAEYLEEKFEALIVDEGQDFLADWWDALDGVLSDDAVFHCFHDANQTLSHCFIIFFKVFPARLPRMLLSGIHFNHGFPIKPSEMTIFYTLNPDYS